MDFEFTEQQRLYRDTVRRVVKEQLEPLAAEYPPDTILPKEAILKAMKIVQPLGALSSRVPESEGGAGLDHISIGILHEEMGPGWTFALFSNESVATRISHSESEDVKKRFLPRLMSGEAIGASATSEPGAGSDPRGIVSTAVLKGDHYIINGTKTWCGNGSISDILLCQASLGKDDKGRNLITRFVIDRAESPYEGKDIETIGLKRHHLCEVYLDDCPVPKENRVGEAGDAHKTLTYTWLTQRIAIGLDAVNLGQKSLDASISYAKERTQFGKVIGSFQMVQNILVDMATLIDASRLLCYRALWLLDQGGWASRESSMAKWFACESALKVTAMGVEVHGGMGLTSELGVERYYRDARMLTIPDGTTNINKLIVGRELTGMRAFS